MSEKNNHKQPVAVAPLNFKQDTRPQRGWWAPGNYINRCVKCSAYFSGDKRAGWCADCAYGDAAAAPEAEPVPQAEPEGVRCRAMVGDERPRTMQEREGAAEAALMRDIAKKREEYEIIMIPKYCIPEGAKLVECYETATEWVVVGEPGEEIDADGNMVHDCDAMGCCTLSHVVARIQKPSSPTDPAQRRSDDQAE